MIFSCRTDPARARIHLRDRLIALASSAGAPFDVADVPNSYGANPLLQCAARFLGSAGNADEHTSLWGHTALALTLHGDRKQARELLQAGVSTAREKQNRARYLFHLGYDVHRPHGEQSAALDALREALVYSERSRRLRGEIHVATGLTALEIDSPYTAERAFRAALDLHIRELNPFAHAGLGRVARLRGHLPAAIRENRRARLEFVELGGWRGVRSCDSDLAAFHLLNGDPIAALDSLRGAIAQNWEVLDKDRLGTSHRLYARALWEADRHDDAVAAGTRAVRYLQPSSRQDAYGRALLDYARTHMRLKRWEPATWAVGAARRAAAGVGNARDEFRALTFALGHIARGARLRLDIHEATLRCHQLITTRGHQLTRESLLEFTAGVASLDRDTAPDTPADTPPETPSFEPPGPFDVGQLLSARLGDGLAGRHSPPRDQLHLFLLQFTGSYLRSGNYTREFGMTQERAKRHLRTLCKAGILERHGTRKASRYSLAFHRDDALT